MASVSEPRSGLGQQLLLAHSNGAHSSSPSRCLSASGLHETTFRRRALWATRIRLDEPRRGSSQPSKVRTGTCAGSRRLVAHDAFSSSSRSRTMQHPIDGGGAIESKPAEPPTRVEDDRAFLASTGQATTPQRLPHQRSDAPRARSAPHTLRSLLSVARRGPNR